VAMVGGYCGHWWLGIFLSVERGDGGLQTLWWPSLTCHPASFVIVIAAVDSNDGVCCHHQTSQH